MKRLVLILGAAVFLARTLTAQDVGFSSAWLDLSASDRDQVMRFAEEFKDFMSRSKSELIFIREATAFAEANRFRKWDSAVSAADLKPGSRWYAVNRDRTM